MTVDSVFENRLRLCPIPCVSGSTSWPSAISTAVGIESDTGHHQRQQKRQQKHQQPPSLSKMNSQSLQFHGAAAAAAGNAQLQLQALPYEQKQQRLQRRQIQQQAQKSLNGAFAALPPFAASVPQASWSGLRTREGGGSGTFRPLPPKARG